MFLKKFKLLSWNVRGLGSDEKCLVVKNTIKNSRCDVCVLQETKSNIISLPYVLRFLPSFFDYDVAFNLAQNSSGGMIIAWKRAFKLVAQWSTRHTITVRLQQTATGSFFTITNAYGPTVDSLKEGFITELSLAASLADSNWLLAGDFNLVRWLTDCSSCCSSFRLMELFNEFISQSGLMDVPLRNRAYTWSNNRAKPVFS